MERLDFSKVLPFVQLDSVSLWCAPRGLIILSGATQSCLLILFHDNSLKIQRQRPDPPTSSYPTSNSRALPLFLIWCGVDSNKNVRF